MKNPFTLTSTHEAALAAKDAEIAALTLALFNEEQRAERIAGKLLRADQQARKVPHLEAEAAIMQASLSTLLRVVRGMDMEWGFPAAELADRVALDEKVVRSVLRALEAGGLAKRHPFFSEDTHLINGSGYSLTAAGEKLRTMLPADRAPLPIAA